MFVYFLFCLEVQDSAQSVSRGGKPRKASRARLGGGSEVTRFVQLGEEQAEGNLTTAQIFLSGGRAADLIQDRRKWGEAVSGEVQERKGFSTKRAARPWNRL